VRESVSPKSIEDKAYQIADKLLALRKSSAVKPLCCTQDVKGRIPMV